MQSPCGSTTQTTKETTKESNKGLAIYCIAGSVVVTEGPHRGSRHDYIEDSGSFIKGAAQGEGGVIDVDSSGEPWLEGRGVGVCQGEGGVGCEGG